MKQFKVMLEWIDGTVTEEIVSEVAWFKFFYEAIETNDYIEHYGVDTI